MIDMIDGGSQKRYWESGRHADRRHPSHPVISAYVLPKIDIITAFTGLKRSDRLLDVGCGNGYFTFYFDKVCNVCGIDFSDKMLAMNPVKKTLQMDAADLGFEDGSFEVVFCHALLHHVDDIDKVISEMKRVTNKYVVLLEPNRNNPLMFLFSLLKREERGGLRFSLPFLKKIAQDNGLKVIAAFSYGMLVPNKTPLFLLPVLKLFNLKLPCGMTNFVIAHK